MLKNAVLSANTIGLLNGYLSAADNYVAPCHHDCLYSRHFVLALRQLKARETEDNQGINEEVVKVGREMSQKRESGLNSTESVVAVLGPISEFWRERHFEARP